MLRQNLREHGQKAALSSEIRKNTNEPRISKNSATCRIRICDLLQSRDFEFQALCTQPHKLNNRRTLIITNNAATYANKLPIPSAKAAPNTNRLNFASNNLEYNKLKVSTLT